MACRFERRARSDASAIGACAGADEASRADVVLDAIIALADPAAQGAITNDRFDDCRWSLLRRMLDDAMRRMKGSGRAERSVKSRPATLAFALALSAMVAHADEALRGEVREFGRTVGRPGEDMPPEGQSGLAPAGTIENIRYLERTDRIEARLCRNFGMTVHLVASPPSQVPREVEGRVLHPLMTRPDGRQGTEARARIAVVDGATYVGFTFDQGWELVAGLWTVIVSSRDREIARKDFTVTLPPPGAPNSDCGVG